MIVDKNRLWIICSVLVMALVVAGGWFLGVQPQPITRADRKILVFLGEREEVLL